MSVQPGDIDTADAVGARSPHGWRRLLRKVREVGTLRALALVVRRILPPRLLYLGRMLPLEIRPLTDTLGDGDVPGPARREAMRASMGGENRVGLTPGPAASPRGIGGSQRDVAPARPAGKPRTQVVRMTDEHAEGVADFIRQVWDREATPESLRRARAAAAAANPVAPGEEAPTILLLVDGRVVGHLTTIPVGIWSGERERAAHWMKGLMVLPEYQNGPVGFALLREGIRHVGCALAVAVQPSAYRLFEAAGFANLGVMTNHLRLLEPGRVLARLDIDRIGLSGLPTWLSRAVRMVRCHPIPAVLGAGAKVLLGVWTVAGELRTRGLSVQAMDEDADPGELDRLWQAVRRSIRAAPVRDGRHLTWRYPAGAGHPYTFVTVREHRTLVGFGVVRRPRKDGDPRLGGVAVGTLSDIVFPIDRREVGRAVLVGADAAARRLEADALVCSASHPSLRALLTASGYIPLPGNLHFLERDPGGTYALPTRLAEWWLTRGDSNADEVF